MDLNPWQIEYVPDWDEHFKEFDATIRAQILKKLEQMKQALSGRGLHGTHYLVEEVGQYRIAFKQESSTRTKSICFVGNHKQYERWYKQLPEIT